MYKPEQELPSPHDAKTSIGGEGEQQNLLRVTLVLELPPNHPREGNGFESGCEFVMWLEISW